MLLHHGFFGHGFKTRVHCHTRARHIFLALFLAGFLLVWPLDRGKTAAGPLQAWSVVGGMPQGASIFQGGALLPDGRVLATGEQTSSIFEPATSQWVPSGRMTTWHGPHYSLVELSTGQVLLAGSAWSGGPSAELYDPATGVWRPTGPMVFDQLYGTAVRLADGRVLVAGGCVCARFAGTAEVRSEIYDPSSGQWHEVGELNVSREDATATLLNDGKVLIAGGWSDNRGHEEVTATAELFNPATGRWTLTGSMHTGREFQTATLLQDGEVLVTGGDDFSVYPQGELASAEIYNPVSGTWRTVAPMSVGRRFHSATLLQDGRVLVVGGESRAVPLASAEIYDPTTNVWGYAGALHFPRLSHQAVLLQDGKVLVFGGGNLEWGWLSSAELFDPAVLNAPDTTPTATSTITLTPTATLSPTVMPSPTATPTATPVPTMTATPTSTSTLGHPKLGLAFAYVSVRWHTVREGTYEHVEIQGAPRRTLGIWVQVRFPTGRHYAYYENTDRHGFWQKSFAIPRKVLTRHSNRVLLTFRLWWGRRTTRIARSFILVP